MKLGVFSVVDNTPYARQGSDERSGCRSHRTAGQRRFYRFRKRMITG